MPREIGYAPGTGGGKTYESVVNTPAPATEDSYFESEAWKTAVAEVQAAVPAVKKGVLAEEKAFQTTQAPAITYAPATPTYVPATPTYAPPAVKAYLPPIVKPMPTYSPPAVSPYVPISPSSVGTTQQIVTQPVQPMPPVPTYAPAGQPELGPVSMFTPPAQALGTIGAIAKDLFNRAAGAVKGVAQELVAPIAAAPETTVFPQSSYWQNIFQKSAERGYPATINGQPYQPTELLKPSGLAETLPVAGDFMYNAFRKSVGSPIRAASLTDAVNSGVDFIKAVSQTPKIDAQGNYVPMADYGKNVAKTFGKMYEQTGPTAPIFSPLGTAGRETYLSRANMQLTNVLPERLLWVANQANQKFTETYPKIAEMGSLLTSVLNPATYANASNRLPERLTSFIASGGIGAAVKEAMSASKDPALTAQEWLDRWDEGQIGYSLSVNPQPARTKIGPWTIQSDTPDMEQLIISSGGRVQALRSLVADGATVDQAARKLQVPLTEFALSVLLDLSWLPSIGGVQKGAYQVAWAPWKAELGAAGKLLSKVPVASWLAQKAPRTIINLDVRAKGDAVSELFAQGRKPYEALGRIASGDESVYNAVSDFSVGHLRQMFEQFQDSALFGNVVDESQSTLEDSVRKMWDSFGDKGINVEDATAEQLRRVLERSYRSMITPGAMEYSGTLAKGFNTLIRGWRASILGLPGVVMRNAIRDSGNRQGAYAGTAALDVVNQSDKLARMVDWLDEHVESGPLRPLVTGMVEAVKEVSREPRLEQIKAQISKYGMAVPGLVDEGGFVPANVNVGGLTEGETPLSDIPIPLIGRPSGVVKGVNSAKQFVKNFLDQFRGKQPAAAAEDIISTLSPIDESLVGQARTLGQKIANETNVAGFQEANLRQFNGWEKLNKAGGVLTIMEDSSDATQGPLAERMYDSLLSVTKEEPVAALARDRFRALPVYKAMDANDILDQAKEFGARKLPSDLLTKVDPDVAGHPIFVSYRNAINKAAIDGTLTIDEANNLAEKALAANNEVANSQVRTLLQQAKQAIDIEQGNVLEMANVAKIEEAQKRLYKLPDSKERAAALTALDDIIAEGKVRPTRRAAAMIGLANAQYTSDEINDLLALPRIRPTVLGEAATAGGMAAPSVDQKTFDALYTHGYSISEINSMSASEAAGIATAWGMQDAATMPGGLLLSASPAELEKWTKNLIADGAVTQDQANNYLGAMNLAYRNYREVADAQLALIAQMNKGDRAKALSIYYPWVDEYVTNDYNPRLAKLGNDLITGQEIDPAKLVERLDKNDPIRSMVDIGLNEEVDYIQKKRSSNMRQYAERQVDLRTQLDNHEITPDAYKLASDSNWLETDMMNQKVKYDAHLGQFGDPSVPESPVSADHPVRLLERRAVNFDGSPVVKPANVPEWTSEDLARRGELEQRVSELEMESAQQRPLGGVGGEVAAATFADPSVRAKMLSITKFNDDGTFAGWKNVWDPVAKKYIEPATGTGGLDEMASRFGYTRTQDLLDQWEEQVGQWAMTRKAQAGLMDAEQQLSILNRKYTPLQIEQLTPVQADKLVKAQIAALQQTIAEDAMAGRATSPGLQALLSDLNGAQDQIAADPIIQLNTQRVKVNDAINAINAGVGPLVLEQAPMIEANKALSDAIEKVRPAIVKDVANTLQGNLANAVQKVALHNIDFLNQSNGEYLAKLYSPFPVGTLKGVMGAFASMQNRPQLITQLQRWNDISAAELEKQGFAPQSRFAGMIPMKVNNSWVAVGIQNLLYSFTEPLALSMKEEDPEQATKNAAAGIGQGWRAPLKEVVDALGTVGLDPYSFTEPLLRWAKIKDNSTPLPDVSPWSKYVRALTKEATDPEHWPLVGTHWVADKVLGLSQEDVYTDYYTREALDIMVQTGEIGAEAARLAKVQGMKSPLYARTNKQVKLSSDYRAIVANFWPLRTKVMAGEVKDIIDNQNSYYKMRDEAAKILDPKKQSAAYKAAGEFWDKTVKSHYDTVNPELIEQSMKEDLFEKLRTALDERYLPEIASLNRAGASARAVKQVSDQYYQERTALYDKYADIVATWNKGDLPSQVREIYSQLVGQKKYDEADSLIRNLAVTGTPKGTDRERMMWEPKYMGVTYDQYMADRISNDTPEEALRRLKRDEHYSPTWDVVSDKTKTSEEKAAAEKLYDAMDQQTLVNRVLELRPEWATDVEALTRLANTRTPTFDELSRENDTPGAAMMKELTDAIYRDINGDERGYAGQIKVRELLGTELTDAVYAKKGEWFDDPKNKPKAQKALALLGRVDKLVSEGFPEAVMEGAPLPTPGLVKEPAALTPTNNQAYSVLAAHTVNLLASTAFGAEMVANYSVWQKYNAQGGKGQIPPDLVPYRDFLKTLRSKFGIEYNETADEYQVKSIPSWFTPAMTAEELAQKIGMVLPSATIRSESPELAKALVTAGGTPAWFEGEKAAATKSTTTAKKTTTTAKKSYTTASSKKTTTTAKAAAPAAVKTKKVTKFTPQGSVTTEVPVKKGKAAVMDWQDLATEGGATIQDELVRYWSGRGELSQDAQAWLQDVYTQRASTVTPEEWIAALKAEWEKDKYTFDELDIEQYKGKLTWGQFKDRASPLLALEIEDMFYQVGEVSDEGWSFFKQIAEKYGNGEKPEIFFARLFKSWRYGLQLQDRLDEVPPDAWAAVNALLKTVKA
jgi:hypothetical protein